MQTLATPLVWILALPYFCYFTLGNSYIFWAPLLVRSALHTSDSATSIVASAIALLAVAAYFIAAAQSDRRGERCGYSALGLALQAAGWIGARSRPIHLCRWYPYR